MLYNAVLVIKEVGLGESSSTIFGRVLIQDLEEVPTELMPQYRGKFISNEVDIGSLMCSPEEPLHLIGFVQSEPSENSDNPASLGEIYKDFYVTSDDSSDGGSDSGHGNGSSSTPTSSKLISPLLPKRSIREGYLRIRGSKRKLKYEQNANNRRTDKSPVRSFKMYEAGMNLRGTCINERCSSKYKRSKTDNNSEVVVNANYGRILMTKLANRFPCPACTIHTDGIKGERERKHAYLPSELERTMVPEGFYLTYGRALFRLKKKGVEEPVKMILFENIKSMKTCKIYRDSSIISNDETGESEYDFIEVMTVAKNSSPFFCAKCNHRIEEKEVMLGCGHALHSNCQSVSGWRHERCPICISRLYKSVTELLESPGLQEILERLLTGGTQDDKPPYQWMEGMEMGVVEKWDKEREDGEVKQEEGMDSNEVVVVDSEEELADNYDGDVVNDNGKEEEKEDEDEEKVEEEEENEKSSYFHHPSQTTRLKN